MGARFDVCCGIPLECHAAKYKCGCRSQWLYELFLLLDIPVLRVYANSQIQVIRHNSLEGGMIFIGMRY